jgi:hypothetical protein
MNPVEFWFQHLGRYLDPSLAPHQSTGLSLPHRTNKGVKALRIGAIDAFYVACPAKSKLIGRVEVPSSASVQVLPAEQVSARKTIADWLIDDAEAPFMVGVIGNANPNASMAISHTPARCTFCDAAGRLVFDLGKVRAAAKLFAGMPWKDIATGIHQYARVQMATSDQLAFEKEKLSRLFQKTPEMRRVLVQADIRPFSGEYAVLAWSQIER